MTDATDKATAHQAAVEYMHAMLDRDYDGAVAAFNLYDSMVFDGQVTMSEAAKFTIACAHIALRLTRLFADANDLTPHEVLDLIAEPPSSP